MKYTSKIINKHAHARTRKTLSTFENEKKRRRRRRKPKKKMRTNILNEKKKKKKNKQREYSTVFRIMLLIKFITS